MKRLLITGVSGFLGEHLCSLAQAQWQVYGTYQTQPVTHPGVQSTAIDLTDFQALRDLFNAVRPDAVIHAAALSSPNRCQADPEAAYQINVIASWNIAGLSADRAIPCAFTSSELVFDGLNPPYRETDPVCPVSLYGEQKVAAEVGMLERCPHAIICRMPLMFGVATAPSFIQPWVAHMREGRSLNLFTDEIRTPVGATTAAGGILLALEKVTGRLHLGGKERLSRYAFGCLLAEVLQLPVAQLNPCRQTDMMMAAPRPPDVSMDSSLAFSLGYKPGTVRDELAAIAHLL